MTDYVSLFQILAQLNHFQHYIFIQSSLSLGRKKGKCFVAGIIIGDKHSLYNDKPGQYTIFGRIGALFCWCTGRYDIEQERNTDNREFAKSELRHLSMWEDNPWYVYNKCDHMWCHVNVFPTQQTWHVIGFIALGY